MSTINLSPVLDSAIANVLSKFRHQLIQTYLDTKKNCIEARCEAMKGNTNSFVLTASG
ncbi:MAG: hypothetical protein KJ757_01005 [Planctomycetes bacterium]|nr:hypothetical protein [Planctomycetota bacterium]MBU1517811.1 hypothetical protein [Planctomycetota bacterium]MBU2457275.1 hypothetical protein [Planctomycetota bacterium]MBU2596132.1 hypothetical protein [Planctomycetota bacterium]